MRILLKVIVVKAANKIISHIHSLFFLSQTLTTTWVVTAKIDHFKVTWLYVIPVYITEIQVSVKILSILSSLHLSLLFDSAVFDSFESLLIVSISAN